MVLALLNVVVSSFGNATRMSAKDSSSFRTVSSWKKAGLLLLYMAVVAGLVTLLIMSPWRELDSREEWKILVLINKDSDATKGIQALLDAMFSEANVRADFREVSAEDFDDLKKIFRSHRYIGVVFAISVKASAEHEDPLVTKIAEFMATEYVASQVVWLGIPPAAHIKADVYRCRQAASDSEPTLIVHTTHRVGISDIRQQNLVTVHMCEVPTIDENGKKAWKHVPWNELLNDTQRIAWTDSGLDIEVRYKCGDYPIVYISLVPDIRLFSDGQENVQHLRYFALLLANAADIETDFYYRPYLVGLEDTYSHPSAMSSECWFECHGHGVCSSGVCECENWAGDYCERAAVLFISSSAVHDYESNSVWDDNAELALRNATNGDLSMQTICRSHEKCNRNKYYAPAGLGFLAGMDTMFGGYGALVVSVSPADRVYDAEEVKAAMMPDFYRSFMLIGTDPRFPFPAEFLQGYTPCNYSAGQCVKIEDSDYYFNNNTSSCLVPDITDQPVYHEATFHSSLFFVREGDTPAEQAVLLHGSNPIAELVVTRYDAHKFRTPIVVVSLDGDSTMSTSSDLLSHFLSHGVAVCGTQKVFSKNKLQCGSCSFGGGPRVNAGVIGSCAIADHGCWNCPPNMFNTGDFDTCQPCPNDTYSGWGYSHCISGVDPQVCPPGFREHDPLSPTWSSCVGCWYGEYSANGTECVPCGPRGDSNRNASHCVTCPPGYIRDFDNCYQCNSGTYEDGTGTECLACPAGYVCPADGMTEDDIRRCPPGTHSDEYAYKFDLCHECPAGYYEVDRKDCIVCPLGTAQVAVGQTHCNECPEGTFSNKTATVECTKCEGSDRCLGGGRCAAGYDGELCGSCDAGYFNMQGACMRCPDDNWIILVLAVVALMFVVFMLSIGLDREVMTSLKLLFDHWQHFLITITIAVDWPTLFPFLSVLLGLLDLDISVGGIECIYPRYTWELSYIITLNIPVAMVALAVLLDLLLSYMMMRLKLRPIPEKDPSASPRAILPSTNQINFHKLQTMRSNLRRLVVFFLLMLYTPFSKKALEAFMCNESSSKYVLRTDSSVDCTTIDHSLFYAISALVVTGVTYCAPAWLASFISGLRRQQRLDEPACVQRYGPIYESYKRNCAWFETVMMYRRSVLVTAVMIPPTKGVVVTTQATLVLAVHIIYLCVLVKLRPFALSSRDKKRNVFNALAMGSAFTQIALALLAVNSAANGENDAALFWTVVAIQLVFTLILLVMGPLASMREYLKNRQQRKKESAAQSRAHYALILHKRDIVQYKALQKDIGENMRAGASLSLQLAVSPMLRLRGRIFVFLDECRQFAPLDDCAWIEREMEKYQTPPLYLRQESRALFWRTQQCYERGRNERCQYMEWQFHRAIDQRYFDYACAAADLFIQWRVGYLLLLGEVGELAIQADDIETALECTKIYSSFAELPDIDSEMAAITRRVESIQKLQRKTDSALFQRIRNKLEVQGQSEVSELRLPAMMLFHRAVEENRLDIAQQIVAETAPIVGQYSYAKAHRIPVALSVDSVAHYLQQENSREAAAAYIRETWDQCIAFENQALQLGHLHSVGDLLPVKSLLHDAALNNGVNLSSARSTKNGTEDVVAQNEEDGPVVADAQPKFAYEPFVLPAYTDATHPFSPPYASIIKRYRGAIAECAVRSNDNGDAETASQGGTRERGLGEYDTPPGVAVTMFLDKGSLSQAPLERENQRQADAEVAQSDHDAERSSMAVTAKYKVMLNGRLSFILLLILLVISTLHICCC